jgi:hypothetical protein
VKQKAEAREKSPPPKIAKTVHHKEDKKEVRSSPKLPAPSHDEKEQVGSRADKFTPKRSDSHDGSRRRSSHETSSAKRKKEEREKDEVVDRTPLAEQKRSNYLNYLHRGGPAHPGSKAIPEVGNGISHFPSNMVAY